MFLPGKIVCSNYIFLKVHHHFNQLDAVQGQSEKLNKQLRGFVISYQFHVDAFQEGVFSQLDVVCEAFSINRNSFDRNLIG